MGRADECPVVIQGGMGVAVSHWRLARTVAQAGGLGVISGVGPDLMLARLLQDGDPDGDVRRVLAAFPDQDLVARTLTRFFRPDGLEPGRPYRPIPKLDLHQRMDAVRLSVLGTFVQVALAKEGHDGQVGVNLLEKVQIWTPAALLGAMLADVDVVLVGAGVPSHLPRLLDSLAGLDPVTLPIDVAGARSDDSFSIDLDPRAVVPGLDRPLRRPAFLAIVSAHVLATYLARSDDTRPDGFVIEGPTAGGHNAPPRRPELDETGQVVYGPRDVVDLAKVAATGLPFWLAGGYGTPEQLAQARATGARGVQIGTVFALSRESGMRPDLRAEMLDALAAGTLDVRTDGRASPTGFPFKVVQMPGTVADPIVLKGRERICDLGYLRTLFRRDDGTVGYRCPSEPIDAFVKKGGQEPDTEGRLCLCNGLLATAGHAQRRPDSAGLTQEPPLLTLGQDLDGARRLLEAHPEGWSALDVMTWLLPASDPASSSVSLPSGSG
jgi:NAD(P)H-dependent flavin oxidoreductase YrpB (nitropropane dioxygenase family)